MDHCEIAARVPVMNEVKLLFPSKPCKPLQSFLSKTLKDRGPPPPEPSGETDAQLAFDAKSAKLVKRSLLLSGEASIGESRLIAALLEHVASEPATRLRY